MVSCVFRVEQGIFFFFLNLLFILSERWLTPVFFVPPAHGYIEIGWMLLVHNIIMIKVVLINILSSK